MHTYAAQLGFMVYNSMLIGCKLMKIV